jgi:hypothetical protein
MNLHRITALAALTGAAAIPVSGAAAKNGNDGRVVKRGSCSDGSTWKLKVKPDDTRLEVEFEVDQNRNGVPWKVTLRNDGAVVASGTRTTRAPSGSFSFERRVAGGTGDRISARATRAGETCRGSVTAP